VWGLLIALQPYRPQHPARRFLMMALLAITDNWRTIMTTLAPRAISASRRASALYCNVYGSGTPLLLVHGLGTSGAVFQSLLPALSARYQVIVPDLRGHRHSRCLPGPDSVTDGGRS